MPFQRTPMHKRTLLKGVGQRAPSRILARKSLLWRCSKGLKKINNKITERLFLKLGNFNLESVFRFEWARNQAQAQAQSNCTCPRSCMPAVDHLFSLLKCQRALRLEKISRDELESSVDPLSQRNDDGQRQMCLEPNRPE